MKEYFEEDRKIIEYELSDWESGIINNAIVEHSKSDAFLMIKGGVHVYTRLPKDQYELIDIERKKLYWEKVDRYFKSFKKSFLDQYKLSGNPDRLLQIEIDKYEALFFSEKCQLKGIPTNDDFPIDGLNIYSINIIEYRKLYEKIYLKGNREYHHTNSPNCKEQIGSGDYHFVIVEAYAKYLTWLQNFDETSIIMAEIDLERIKPYMAENDFDFYYNADNIPNQDLVFATIEHFESGPRKGVIQPLDFLNLLWKEKEYINENIKKTHTVIEALKNRPFPEELLHILLGFILKWAGGYPIHFGNPNHNSTYRLIEKEFKKFPIDTPEKEFCHKDCDRHVHLKQVEKELEDIYNGNGRQVSAALQKEVTYAVNLDGFTNSQIVLVFYYFFKYAGIEPRRDMDIAPMAKFIHLITDKELTSVANSDYYKKLQRAPNFKTDKQLIKDCEIISPYFSKVGLNEIVKMIENEIDLARNELKKP
uniref:Uncharacterized protein n=1 Tax=Roseihalotalea indica TaxID=2867963 RepID=A0AA49GJV9_9BACT|nr:hypothetical protein K4G66_22025 [Tunicatimonas sp. TK19036]